MVVSFVTFSLDGSQTTKYVMPYSKPRQLPARKLKRIHFTRQMGWRAHRQGQLTELAGTSPGLRSNLPALPVY